MMKKALALVLLLSLAYAGEIWKMPTFGEIEAKPVFFEDKMAIASHDGTVYYVYAQTGGLVVKKDIGERADWLGIAEGRIVAASLSGIVMLDKSGNTVRTINESTVYGMGIGDKIYATTAAGLKAYDFSGNMMWIVPEKDKVLTEPLVLEDMVIYGAGDELVAVSANGTEIRRMEVAPFWKSRPAYYGGIAYIGSTDGWMYAVDLNKGRVAWRFGTGAWVMSNPLYSQGTLYFGSNNGNVYAVGGSAGNLIWSRKTGEAVQGGMEMAALGDRQAVLVGSNDNRVYALDARTGNITLAYAAGGWVRNPTMQSGVLYFGSYDGSYYAYLPDRSCSIDYPEQGESVGYSKFGVGGRVFSENAGAEVFIRVNNMSWASASVSGNDWAAEVDPNNYAFGPMFVECRVRDRAGEESKGYTYLVLYRDIAAQMGKMGVQSPLSVTQGRAFTVRAYDESGAPLQDFYVAVAGKNFPGKNGTASVSVDAEPKEYNMLVRKTGYQDEKVVITVNYDYTTMLAVAAVAIGVLATAFYLFVYKKK